MLSNLHETHPKCCIESEARRSQRGPTRRHAHGPLNQLRGAVRSSDDGPHGETGAAGQQSWWPLGSSHVRRSCTSAIRNDRPKACRDSEASVQTKLRARMLCPCPLVCWLLITVTCRAFGSRCDC